ncbi:hypothetical protein [Neisseria dumasiana]|uniref:Adhesin n=1 Tax=Neisseria dumasiana TaxID=1931275 RepID=A0ABX3WJX6_9NEIS|nr:hypothetical protein [Neisseria dumasiana]OSI33506.1 hypothetical protein BV913_08770 [Neisseria dumasiana]UOO85072.1 hypothetical protein LVJ88_03515 [Neisseria dumasiana]
MPHHIRLAILALLYHVSVPAFAQPAEHPKDAANGYFPGMLIVENNFVRLQDCTRRQHYSLLPYKKYGYEAMAELISIRKNTPSKTPVYVALKGEIEYAKDNTPTDTFLVSGIDTVKVGENCYIDPVPVKSDHTHKTLSASRLESDLETTESNATVTNINTDNQKARAIPEHTDDLPAQPETVVTQPETVVNQPKTVVTQPETVVTQPETVVTQPETVVTQPETVVTQPETVVTQPETVVTQPETVVTQPETVVNQPETTLTEDTAFQNTSEITQPEITAAESEIEFTEPVTSNTEFTQDAVQTVDSHINRSAPIEMESDKEPEDNGFPIMKEPVSSGIPLPSAIRMPVKTENNLSEAGDKEQVEEQESDSKENPVDISAAVATNLYS